ncbi:MULTISPECIES: protein-export chaperone SecB [unclassified Luteimonas]|uniref:protein-export chaperone SecB n=1 Tax=unclassified Luteimonas TaxID=2629088 RepID=UPI0018F07C59|nr:MULTISPECIES: protein-export chaperone SecB [unclassified Luteimonas]MBJ6982069.1 protein-export chaperone SecB [Luteimonas sp. MC1572]MBJ7575352.1 protein-export chaperone SecB [Luteimonas sp. MC1828]QQO03365.1 protein-export chaperone SecB [Luteimonas sp. MC1572]
MSDQAQNGAAGAIAEQPAGPQFTVEKIYVKDVSFEAPKTPQAFGEQGQPQLQMNLNQRVTRLADSAFEVVLGINLTCNMGEDKTLYVVEVQQAGMFNLVDFDDQALDVMLGTHCPAILYPYARQVIGDLIQAGGFTPFLLQPINFESLYAEGVRQRAAQQAAGDLANTETGGTA